jgi:Tfp pilus assembly protein PilO
MRFLLPILFIIAAVGLFIGFTNPVYVDVQNLSTQAESFNEALENSKALQSERDKLTTAYNNFNRSDVEALETMVPDSVDNIGLIQEIQRLALELGIIVKNVNFDPDQVELEDGEFEEGAEPTMDQTVQERPGRGTAAANTLYDTFLLEFTITGSYDGFVEFMSALERNLRIVDISSIEFTATSLDSDGNFSDVYDYTFTTRTYRLISE